MGGRRECVCRGKCNSKKKKEEDGGVPEFNHVGRRRSSWNTVILSQNIKHIIRGEVFRTFFGIRLLWAPTNTVRDFTETKPRVKQVVSTKACRHPSRRRYLQWLVSILNSSASDSFIRNDPLGINSIHPSWGNTTPPPRPTQTPIEYVLLKGLDGGPRSILGGRGVASRRSGTCKAILHPNIKEKQVSLASFPPTAPKTTWPLVVTTTFVLLISCLHKSSPPKKAPFRIRRVVFASSTVDILPPPSIRKTFSHLWKSSCHASIIVFCFMSSILVSLKFFNFILSIISHSTWRPNNWQSRYMECTCIHHLKLQYGKLRSFPPTTFPTFLAVPT